jgi:H+/gluconate symporter-like permease
MINEVFFDNFLVIIYLLVVNKKNNNIKIIKIYDSGAKRSGTVAFSISGRHMYSM